MLAPSSICLAAICNASSYFPSEISRANFREPATFVLSPTFVKLLVFTSTFTASRPLTFSVWAVLLVTLSYSATKLPVFVAESPFFMHLATKRSVFVAKDRGARPETA